MQKMLLTAALLMLGLGAPEAKAQIVIEVPGRADLPLAVPRPVTPTGDPRGVVEELWQTLLYDFKLSGYFMVIDPAAYLEKGAGVEPGTFEWEPWKPLRTAVLVKTRFLPEGHPQCDPGGRKVCLDVYAYYAVNGEVLLKQRLRADAGSSRALAHKAADTVLQAVTGRPGFFSSQVAAVSSQGGNKEIVLLDLDGKGVQPVTRNGSINISPAFSPDGRSIAWTSYKRGNPDIYVKDLASGRTRVISNKLGVNVSPAFSPDGSKVAVARTSDADSDIFVLDAKTGAVIEQVTKGGGIDVAPCWSPDGTRLVFASERSGGSQVYVKDFRSGEISRVTFNGTFNTDPMFSPDGSEIAFVSREAGGFDIYVVDADGRNVRRVTQDSGDNEDPAWSPDGMYLIFSSTRSGRSELWLATADGQHQMPLTRNGGWTQPIWAPGGR